MFYTIDDYNNIALFNIISACYTHNVYQNINNPLDLRVEHVDRPYKLIKKVPDYNIFVKQHNNSYTFVDVNGINLTIYFSSRASDKVVEEVTNIIKKCASELPFLSDALLGKQKRIFIQWKKDKYVVSGVTYANRSNKG